MVRAVEYWCQSTDTDTDESTIDPPATASTLHANTLDGTVRLDSTLDAIDGAIVSGELARLERQRCRADENAGVSPFTGPRRPRRTERTRRTDSLTTPVVDINNARRVARTRPTSSGGTTGHALDAGRPMDHGVSDIVT
ncbi:MAG: hypothetical protein ABW219_13925 [Ilumatobacteraceae bacterium]